MENWKDMSNWHSARDYHRGQITGARDTYKITDTEALANPKKLTRLICKPPGSSTILSLRRGDLLIEDDAGIEKELTGFITSLAGKEEPIHDMNAHPAYVGKQNHTPQLNKPNDRPRHHG
jgi:hypothetical protein